MSLGFAFSLTPAQVRLLVTVAYERFDPNALWLPVWPRQTPDHFVSIAQRLQAKGLLKHDPEAKGTKPAYTATDEGKAVAKIIVRDALALVAIASKRGKKGVHH